MGVYLSELKGLEHRLCIRIPSPAPPGPVSTTEGYTKVTLVVPSPTNPPMEAFTYEAAVGTGWGAVFRFGEGT